jgi:hypothetical protein
VAQQIVDSLAESGVRLCFAFVKLCIEPDVQLVRTAPGKSILS